MPWHTAQALILLHHLVIKETLDAGDDLPHFISLAFSFVTIVGCLMCDCCEYYSVSREPYLLSFVRLFVVCVLSCLNEGPSLLQPEPLQCTQPSQS